MAKEVMTKKTSPVSKNSSPSISDMLDNLKTQHAQFVQQAKDAETMALKSLGAIEVLTGIDENTKNGEA
jgi:hypothetical protein